MPLKKTSTLLLAAIAVLAAASQPLGAGYVSVYRIKTTYIAEGKGVIGEEIYSKTFLLAPAIQGWQRPINYSLYINGERAEASVKRDSQGNRYLYPGKPLRFSGRVNITLVEYVEVIPPPQREVRLPPDKCEASTWQQERYLYLGGFWGHPYGETTLDDLRKLAETLGGRGLQYIYRVTAWVLTNTRYRLGVRGGVSYPTEFYVEKTGACGDIHAFITAMLRIKGIPSYLYYAYIYRENASMKLLGQKASYATRNAMPHIFSMAVLCGKSFPIDLTYPTARDPYSAVREAGVNTGDRVIVLARIIDADPNDYLLVYAPSNTSRVSLTVDVEKIVAYRAGHSASALLAILSLLLIAALALLSLLKPSTTVGADYV